MYIKVDGVYKQCCENISVKVNGIYRLVSNMYQKVLGEWKEFDLTCTVPAYTTTGASTDEMMWCHYIAPTEAVYERALIIENYAAPTEVVRERALIIENYAAPTEAVYERAAITQEYTG